MLFNTAHKRYEDLLELEPLAIVNRIVLQYIEATSAHANNVNEVVETLLSHMGDYGNEMVYFAKLHVTCCQCQKQILYLILYIVPDVECWHYC